MDDFDQVGHEILQKKYLKPILKMLKLEIFSPLFEIFSFEASSQKNTCFMKLNTHILKTDNAKNIKMLILKSSH